MGKWLLPESLADILPAEARRIEELRRLLLDLYRTYGYELVMPPLVEYLDSLLSASGGDLDLHTFKLVDQMSGRSLGIRADMTPQVTRIDAHLLNRAGTTRLCYCGSVLHTLPRGLWATREPLQIGAELYGHAGPEADIEVLQLALESVRRAGVVDCRVDLSHLGVVRALLETDPAAAARADEIFGLLREKDIPGLTALEPELAPATARALQVLPTLYGELDVLDKARAALPALPRISQALDMLAGLARSLPGVDIGIDLADVRSFHYHTGVVFAVYCGGWPNAVVRGGRYDDVGRVFGRARPATGFSLDLRELAGLLAPATASAAIRAPWGLAPDLVEAVRALRAAGQIVVQILPGHEHDQQEFVCDRELVLRDGAWQVESLASAETAARPSPSTAI
ncbi:ATP phosphoribosyltransferase regulatory subunit [Pigmentiphaga sp.]|uniref:ATP phosphoribosyltransferase regulatory subunit n=1 Tax=Pigmentiphaga sp. TaxID=1977564 RepID=UPI00128DAF6F|nr:ATP phosphoribosyltransferase regulatory subunit [Pigmentiphaga sp.]MPS28564.1 ATP phosphoribosyltransferase regulatory subunit [Alcaligenaceae bacterium SAGV5]MPS52311.1 ATP phosphoribosyltransferase regulatory subunit [Alcaligenaceae bacterium SAGV3]MPT57575.1 ATP phosphoribosyltransferase regulatory subunit [Alcaligenaceae bacterium]